MKPILLLCALLAAAPAFAADWNAATTDAWKTDQAQQQEERNIQRQNQIREYQRQWSYDQRNRGYSQESQPDRYRAYDYGNRNYDYRSP